MSRKDITKTKVSQISQQQGMSTKHLYNLERKYNDNPLMIDKDESGRLH